MSAGATTEIAQIMREDETLAEEQLLAELENEEIPAEIREARMAEFKQLTKNYKDMTEKQHGCYSEVMEEKDFLKVTTEEEKCIMHFFHPDFRRCAIMDTHLKKLAEKYFETRFSKISVEKAKFFVNKLKIQVLPAVICFKNGVVADRIIGFEELGNTDSFQTITLERRLAKCGVIDGSGLESEEDIKKKSIFGFRGTDKQDSDSEDDW
ncbi:hypothetical protein LSH36_247g01010 [Paralvinella palmiformis]|uniref:Thioredoxin domain-containing protein 9 n=1 Tax=Paralvinella palmiformis TaxID=53620 RepID=A0AAD9JL06_9ANNE|nr:hypothetical protein LSH36_247g01010 [Paralvinella palmiformis]